MAERPIGIEDNSVPSCPKCWGCTHRLDLLNLTATWHGQDRNIRMHPGNTGASIFLATRFDGTEAVFKVHGIRTSQVSEAKLAQMDRVYKGRHYSLKEQSTVRYVSSMAEECGLGHINIKEWFEPLRAVFAVTGEKVEERNGIMARRARYPEFVTITRVACCVSCPGRHPNLFVCRALQCIVCCLVERVLCRLFHVVLYRRNTPGARPSRCSRSASRLRCGRLQS